MCFCRNTFQILSMDRSRCCCILIVCTFGNWVMIFVKMFHPQYLSACWHLIQHLFCTLKFCMKCDKEHLCKVFCVRWGANNKVISIFGWDEFFLLKKESDIKGEFVFVLCFQIYFLEIIQLFVAGYVELDQRMKLLQISEIQASYLIIVHFTILFILLRKLLYPKLSF